MSAITVPLDPATDAALDEIAGASGRSKVQVAADLLAGYAQHVAELHELVREAREDIAAGRVHSRGEVAASVQAIIDAAARRP